MSNRETNRTKFDELTKAIDAAKVECERTYGPWCEATTKLQRLERERGEIWDRLMQGILTGAD